MNLGGDKMEVPKCMFCNHFIDNDDVNALPTCKAFPNGIPQDKMWESEETDCNNGIKYEE